MDTAPLTRGPEAMVHPEPQPAERMGTCVSGMLWEVSGCESTSHVSTSQGTALYHCPAVWALLGKDFDTVGCQNKLYFNFTFSQTF